MTARGDSNRTERRLRSSTSDYVASVVRDRILAGHYPLGSRLDQRRLADELGMSVIPVREGLRVLEASGLVNIRRNRGAFVTTSSRKELEEIYVIRQALDPLATEQAVPRMSARVLDRLAVLLDETEAATERRDLDELYRLNREFHLTIYGEARMPVLLQLVMDLRDRYAIYSRLAIAIPDYMARSLADHIAIYDACSARDARRAAESMRRHLAVATEQLLEHLPEATRDEAEEVEAE